MSDTATQPSEDDVRAAQERTERDLAAAGIPTSTPVQQDYYGFIEQHQFIFPDGVTYILHESLNEGARRKYQNSTNKEVAIKRTTGDAVMKMQNGDDRHVLLTTAIVGWNLMRRIDPSDRNSELRPVAFNKGTPGSELEKWLDKADPKLIDAIVKDIHKHNPWLLADMTVEDIDKQIEELVEMRELKVKEEAGNASS